MQFVYIFLAFNLNKRIYFEIVFIASTFLFIESIGQFFYRKPYKKENFNFINRCFFMYKRTSFGFHQWLDNKKITKKISQKYTIISQIPEQNRFSCLTIANKSCLLPYLGGSFMLSENKSNCAMRRNTEKVSGIRQLSLFRFFFYPISK